MTIFFPRCCSMEGESAFSLLPCGEQIGLAGLASLCHLFLKGAKETAKMSESSSEDLIGVKLSFHEGNRVPFMREKIYRVDEGNRVPLKVPLLEGQAHPERDGGRRSPEPLCLPRLGCSAPGEKHPWLAASATW